MSRLPIPGKDSGTWGDILNDYLSQSHTDDGSLKDGIVDTNHLNTTLKDTVIKADTALQPSDSIAQAQVDGLPSALSSKQNASSLEADVAAMVNGSGSLNDALEDKYVVHGTSLPDPDAILASSVAYSARIVAIDLDSRLLRISGADLQRSSDGGTTWATIWTAPTSISAIRCIESGELFIGLQSDGAARTVKGQFWVTSGYVSGSPTFTQKLIAADYQQEFNLKWSGIGSNGIYAVNAYDSANTGSRSADQPCWLTTDGGGTWTQIGDFADTGEPNLVIGQRHIHGSAYDVYRDAVWVTCGDGTSQGLYVSWDHGSTWTLIEITSQATTVFPLPECVVFGSDGTPSGIWRIDNPSPTSLTLKPAWLIESGSNVTVVCAEASNKRPGGPLIIPFSRTTGGIAYVLASWDGFAWWELWRSTTTYSGEPYGPTRAIGPDSSGDVWISGQADATHYFQAKVPIAKDQSVRLAQQSRAAFMAIPRRSRMSYRIGTQTLTSGSFVELAVTANMTGDNVENLSGLFTLQPDGIHVRVNRPCTVDIRIDSAVSLSWATYVYTGISYNGNSQWRIVPTRLLSHRLKCSAGDTIAAVARQVSGSDKSLVDTGYLDLEAWETF